MNKKELTTQILTKKTYLCVGLDTDIKKIPRHFHATKDPIFEFNKQIIDATYKYCIAYKPNLAFYEALGSKGIESLEKTIEYIPNEIFTIADAKRGDIGNTSEMYAKTFFERMNFDAITLSPYMGQDTVKPFLKYKNKWIILLALTSNESSKDFQLIETKANKKLLYEKVIEQSEKWGSYDDTMYVVGATKSDALKQIRTLIPNHFLLVPGIGAQGGSLKDVSEAGMNKSCGLIVNMSRSIIYASDAGGEAKKVQRKMEQYLEHYM